MLEDYITCNNWKFNELIIPFLAIQNLLNPINCDLGYYLLIDTFNFFIGTEEMQIIVVRKIFNIRKLFIAFIWSRML
jgi:hypothetical protein